NSGYAGNGQNYPTLINATFSGNWARERGGAMYNDGRYSGVSKPVLTNVTFSGNRAELEGGAIYNFGHFDGGESSPTLTNVILWDNSAPTGAIMYNYGQGATPTIAHSLVQGGLSSSNIYNDEGASLNDGGYNIDVDPLFVTPVNPADAPTTAGDLRLQARSLAIGVGDNSVLPMEVTTDLDGNPRIVGSAVDLGAYEFQFDCATVGSRLYV